VGPFLGVYLLAHGWRSGWIGTVMTMAGAAGVMLTTPAGAWVDSTRRKRSLIVLPGIVTIIASLMVLTSLHFWPVALSQVGTAIAGALIGPAVTGITLGMVGLHDFSRQNGINQAYNHAGNAAGAALSGLLGWQFGLPTVFWLAVAMSLASIACVLSIPQECIDDRAARGLTPGEASSDDEASGLSVLLHSPVLLILAGSLALFHLGNAAMLPLYGMAVTSAGQVSPAIFVASTIVVAQVTMVVTSLIAMRLSERRGLWLVILVSLLALPVRGFIAANLIRNWGGVFPVQILDGVGAGLQSVAVPSLVARTLQGTGRINIGQGVVMTVQGVGAALSPALGGWVAQSAGYSAAFVSLGILSLGSIALWLYGAPAIRTADRIDCNP
jgi:MFS family permease